MEKIFWAIVLVAVGGFFIFLTLGSSAPSAANPATQQAGGDAVAAPPGNQQAQQGSPSVAQAQVQAVPLSMQNDIYQPYPITVKVGVPVELVADMSTITGCMTTVVIPEFGIRKTLTAHDNIIEFTPNESGTFDFTCGMGMGKGKLVVENADGSAAAGAATVSTAPATGNICGSGSGGCGCGS